jgi:hypothetical protein
VSRGAALALAIAVTACGRLDFEPRTDGEASGCGHTFCDDFDRAGPVEAGWTAIETTGGTLALDPAVAVSAPNGLLATVPFPLSGDVFLGEALPAITQSVHLTFDLDLEATTPGAEMDLVQLRWTDPAPCTAFGYFFVRDSTGPLVMQETYGDCGTANQNDDLPAADGFHHVDLVVTAGAVGTAALQVAIDGTVVVDKQVDHAIPPSPLELRLGCPGTRDTTAEWRVRYDNVVVDVR